MEQISLILAPLLSAYAGNFGWAVQIVAIVGTFRLFFKPIFAAIEKGILDSESKKDDEALAKVKGSSVYKTAIFLIDIIGSIKIKKEEPKV